MHFSFWCQLLPWFSVYEVSELESFFILEWHDKTYIGLPSFVHLFTTAWTSCSVCYIFVGCRTVFFFKRMMIWGVQLSTLTLNRASWLAYVKLIHPPPPAAVRPISTVWLSMSCFWTAHTYDIRYLLPPSRLAVNSLLSAWIKSGKRFYTRNSKEVSIWFIYWKFVHQLLRRDLDHTQAIMLDSIGSLNLRKLQYAASACIGYCHWSCFLCGVFTFDPVYRSAAIFLTNTSAACIASLIYLMLSCAFSVCNSGMSQCHHRRTWYWCCAMRCTSRGNALIARHRSAL